MLFFPLKLRPKDTPTICEDFSLLTDMKTLLELAIDEFMINIELPSSQSDWERKKFRCHLDKLKIPDLFIDIFVHKLFGG